MLANLNIVSGLLIGDWGNRILPRWFRESIRQYFGKKGMSIFTYALLLSDPGVDSSQDPVLQRYSYTVLIQECGQVCCMFW